MFLAFSRQVRSWEYIFAFSDSHLKKKWVCGNTLKNKTKIIEEVNINEFIHLSRYLPVGSKCFYRIGGDKVVNKTDEVLPSGNSLSGWGRDRALCMKGQSLSRWYIDWKKQKSAVGVCSGREEYRDTVMKRWMCWREGSDCTGQVYLQKKLVKCIVHYVQGDIW